MFFSPRCRLLSRAEGDGELRGLAERREHLTRQVDRPVEHLRLVLLVVRVAGLAAGGLGVVVHHHGHLAGSLLLDDGGRDHATLRGGLGSGRLRRRLGGSGGGLGSGDFLGGIESGHVWYLISEQLLMFSGGCPGLYRLSRLEFFVKSTFYAGFAWSTFCWRTFLLISADTKRFISTSRLRRSTFLVLFLYLLSLVMNRKVSEPATLILALFTARFSWNLNGFWTCRMF